MTRNLQGSTDHRRGPADKVEKVKEGPLLWVGGTQNKVATGAIRRRKESGEGCRGTRIKAEVRRRLRRRSDENGEYNMKVINCNKETAGKEKAEVVRSGREKGRGGGRNNSSGGMPLFFHLGDRDSIPNRTVQSR